MEEKRKHNEGMQGWREKKKLEREKLEAEHPEIVVRKKASTLLEKLETAAENGNCSYQKHLKPLLDLQPELRHHNFCYDESGVYIRYASQKELEEARQNLTGILHKVYP